MGVLQRWGGGTSRRKRAAYAAEEAARVAAEQEAARVAAEQEAARVAAEQAAAAAAAAEAQRQAEEAAQRQRDEYARQQAEILARQQAASAAPPVNAQDVLNQPPAPAPQPFTPTPIPAPTRPAPFNVLPTVNIFSPGGQSNTLPGSLPGSVTPTEIMGVPIPQPANFNIYSPESGGRPTGVLPAVNFFSSLIRTPPQFTNVDPFAPSMGTVQAPAGQTVAFQPTALQYSTIPNIFALRPLGGLV